MVKDPVCGTDIESEDAYYSIFGGKVVYFCCENCKDEYDAGLEEFYRRVVSVRVESKFWPV